MISLIWKKLWILSFALLFLTACLREASFTLNVQEAQIGGSVIATLSNMQSSGATVLVANVAAEVISTSADTLTFTIPSLEEDKLGKQEVLIRSSEKEALGSLVITAASEPEAASFSLDVKEGKSGDSVVASLTNIDGTKATVTVASVTAKITEAKTNSVLFVIPDLPKGTSGEQEVIIKSDAAEAKAEITIIEEVIPVSFKLDKERAERGETVNATVTGLDLEGASLKIAGNTVSFSTISDSFFSFVIPQNTPADSQTVTLTSLDNDPLTENIGVLGDVVKGKITLIVKPETSESTLRTQLASLGYELESSLRPLGLSSGPCSGELAEIDVGETSLGEALSILEELEQNGSGIVLNIDPRGGWAVGSVNHLEAVNTLPAHTRGFKGAGTMIAVLDTGVSPHTELGARFRSDLSYDFVNDDAVPEDLFDDPSSIGAPVEGHGTPIAIIAAGSTSGVAPEAEVMGIKTCSDTGVCFSSDVILGVCHALKEAPDRSKLVLNLSLGGDTPVQALEAILDFALDEGVLVAAAGGNQGEFGSPRHYPAAFPLDGLVAVAALEAPETLSCVDFEAQTLDSTKMVGDSLIDNGVTLSLGEYFFASAGSTVTGSTTIFDDGSAGGFGQDVNTNNINMSFSFPYPLERLSFEYGDYGGSVNLELSGKREVMSGGMTAFDGETIVDSVVTVTADRDVTGAPLQTGTVTISGPITSFAVGGQEFFIDSICPVKSSAWAPADFSTRGDYIDIAAPGVGIRSGIPVGNAYFGSFEGTSFSTPMVAGALALWREANPAMSPSDIEAGLKASATALPFKPEEVGAGLLNLSTDPK